MLNRRSAFAAATSIAGMSGIAGITSAAFAANPPPPRRAPAGHPLRVRDFGAVGDGKTDDSAAIQAALDRAGAGGEVYFADGQYVLSTAMVSKTANVTISGESWNAQLIRAASNTSGLLTVFGTGTLIDTLTFNGTGNQGGSEYAEIGMLANNCQANRLLVVNSSNVGIDASGNHCIVSNCTVLGLANPAVQSYGIWAVNGNQGIMIRGCYVANSGIDGIGISGYDFQIIGNYIINCHAYTGEAGGQLVVYNNQNNTANGLIMGNTIGRGNALIASGMELNGADTNVIGNVIHEQNVTGIYCNGNGWLISGNTIRNAGQSRANNGTGIFMTSGSSSFQITGNRIIDEQSNPSLVYGIIVDNGNSNEYGITGNQITGCTNLPIRDGGSGLNKVIAHNVGLDDVIPNVYISAALVLPVNPVFVLLNGGTVTSFTGAIWTGRSVTILPNSAVTFQAGGNIANTMSVAAHTPVTALFNGSVWYLR